MDDITISLFRRFGFKYKKIPVPYIEYRLTNAIEDRGNGHKTDPDQMKLLYGYMAACGNVSHAPLLRRGLKGNDDPFLTKCTEALESGTGRRAVDKEFRSHFRTLAGSCSSGGNLLNELINDRSFIIISVITFILFLIPVAWSYKDTESAFSDHSMGFLCPPVILTGVLFLKAAFHVPAGLVRTRRSVKSTGIAFLLFAALMALYEISFTAGLLPSQENLPDPFAYMAFIAGLFAFWGSYCLGIRALFRCRTSVTAVVRDIRKSAAKKMTEETVSFNAGYSFNGIRYRKFFSTVEYSMDKLRGLKPGSEVKLLIDPDDPENARPAGCVKILPVLLALLGLLFSGGSLLTIILSLTGGTL